MLKLIIEGTGTFLLTLAVGLTVDPITAGLLLVALLTIGFSVTEVHFNPAVSLGVWAIGKSSTKDFLLRISGQFAGALGASFLVSWIARISYTPQPSQAASVPEFVVLELLFSFLFVLLFLRMLYPDSDRSPMFTGLIIGAGFAGCLLAIESVAGFGMHPALNTGFTLVHFLDDGSSLQHLPVYFFAPLVAAFFAAFTHRWMTRNRD